MSKETEGNQQGSETQAKAPSGTYSYLKDLLDKELSMVNNPRVNRYGGYPELEIRSGNVDVVIRPEPVCEVGGACIDLIIAERVEIAKIEISHMHVTRDDKALELSKVVGTPLAGFVPLDTVPSPDFMVHVVRQTNGDEGPKLKSTTAL